MHSTTNFHVNGSTRVNGEILVVPGSGRTMFFTVEGADRMDRMTFIVNDPVFLDKLSNEADRLCREFVGDVPEGTGMNFRYSDPAPSQAYIDEIGERQTAEVTK